MDSTSARPPPRAHMVACLAMEWLEWLQQLLAKTLLKAT
jgi:hypothetical protein